MQREAKELDPYNSADGTGVLGRLNDVLRRKGFRTGGIAIDGQSIALVGKEPDTIIVGRNGLDEFNPRPSMGGGAMDNIIRDLNGATTSNSGFFAETWSSSLVDSLAQTRELYEALQASSTTHTFPASSIGQQLATVSKLMKLDRGTDRDVFFLNMGGYDTHSQVNANLDRLFGEFDAALGPFVDELKDHDLWDCTVLVETSDFARTLNPNSGDGTDHGWGGNTFVLGGDVRGGFVKGEYPTDLTDSGSNVLSRGRIVPAVPFDALWHSVAEWAGVKDASEMSEILPNVNNFKVSDGTLFEGCDLFESCPINSPTPLPTVATSLPTATPSHPPTASPSISPSPSSLPPLTPSWSPTPTTPLRVGDAQANEQNSYSQWAENHPAEASAVGGAMFCMVLGLGVAAWIVLNRRKSVAAAKAAVKFQGGKSNYGKSHTGGRRASANYVSFDNPTNPDWSRSFGGYKVNECTACPELHTDTHQTPAGDVV